MNTFLPIRNLRSSLRSIVRAHGFMNTLCHFSGLPHSHIHALIELERSPLRAKELGVILQLEKSSISRLVAGLIKQQLITVTTSVHDKREKELSLTTKGRKIVRSTHNKVDVITDTALSSLSSLQVESLSKGLALYARAINKATLKDRVKIRKATKKDDAAMYEIVIAGLDDFGALKPGTIAFDPQVKQLSQALNGKNAIYFVAEIDGQVVGGGGIGPTDGLPKDTLELKRMFIKREARGLGIGKLIMDECLDFASANGFKNCYLETLEELAVARKFYEQEGFIYLKAPLCDTGHHACPYWMIKKLEE